MNLYELNIGAICEPSELVVNYLHDSFRLSLMRKTIIIS